jgi:hypothetical protein
VSGEKVHGPCFFTETTVTGDPFLDMLESSLLPQLNTSDDDPLYDWTELSPIFTRMYECFSIVFFHSTGPNVLQMETTTFSVATPFAGSHTMRFLSLWVR